MLSRYGVVRVGKSRVSHNVTGYWARLTFGRYCTETRPYNQGSRLTAFELVYEQIPGTLITDSMVAALMRVSASLSVCAPWNGVHSPPHTPRFDIPYPGKGH